MLSHIQIRDLAVISRLELDCGGGLTALTGETGAGKSILVDALGLALGDKADAGVIRAGAERAEIIASFDLERCPAAGDWLVEQSLDDEGECILRRLIPREGRSRAYVNGRAAGSAQLRELGNLLVDIHSQHAHQSLLRPASQRDLLDAYGGHTGLAASVAAAFKHFRGLERRLDELGAAAGEREARIELLREQVDELTALGLTAEELETLDQEQRRLANLDRLQADAAGVLALLDESDPGLADQLASAAGRVGELTDLDSGLEEARALLDTAAIHAQEAASAVRHYLDGLDLDPSALASVEERLARIHELARKHRCLPQLLPELLDERSQELEQLESADQSLDALRAERDAAWEDYREQAAHLGAARTDAAKRLGATVTEAMQGLGMKGGRFEVSLAALADADAGAGGMERVELIVGANPGQPMQPLARVASGGELSRISLCIQVATAECGSVPTLVFDEVDVGIGGGVAEIVGRLLRRLGTARQVLCVTHLPQVAAQAHGQLRVSKETDGGETHTRILPLGDQERIEEIARMLGGTEITRRTREHAMEMLERGRRD